MADQIDRYFGRLVLDQRLATTQQIELCISEQTRRTAQGRPTSLSELTGERGILSARQIKGLLAQMNLRVLDCGACGQTHTLVGPRADKQLECKGCGNLLTDSAPAVTADIASQSDRDATMTDTPHPDAGAGMHDKTLPPDSTRLGPMTLDSQPPTQISPFRGKDPARPLNEDPLIGRHLSGKYEIIEHIGRGGMGAVYRARHTKLDRLCAVKVLPRELSDRPDLLQRFRREAQATARLAQKQVVTIFDVDTDGPTEYLAMEFIEGQTLEKLVQQKGKFRVKTSLQIIRQAAVGLAAAHREGIIHRDIKPANLMLTNDGMIKVMDFGLAQLVEITSLISEQGQILGTPHFMAPEQAEGVGVDQRSDIYSLGATLFYLLTGRLPHRAPTPAAILLKVVFEDPPSVQQFDPTISDAVADLALKMMARKPEERFRDCSDLVRSIESMLPEHSGRGPAPTVIPQPAPALPPKQLKTIGGGLVSGLLLLAILLFSINGTDPQPEALERRRTADEAAYAQLMEVLAQRLVSPDEKCDACRSFLDRHSESVKAKVVKGKLEDWELASEKLWSERWGRLHDQVKQLARKGDTAGARSLVQTFLENKPAVSVAANAATLLASLRPSVGTGPENSPELTDLWKKVQPLLEKDQYGLAIQKLSLHITQHPGEQQQLEKLLTQVEQMVQTQIAALQQLLERQRTEKDKVGAQQTYDRLEKLGAKNLGQYSRWLEGSGTTDPRQSSLKALVPPDKLRRGVQGGNHREALSALRSHREFAKRNSKPLGALIRDLEKRLALALVSRGNHQTALELLQESIDANEPIGLLLGAICESRAGNTVRAGQCGRKAFLDGVPTSERALAKLRVIPQFGDTLELTDGTVLRGSLRQQTPFQFHYRTDRQNRIFSDSSRVKSVKRPPPDKDTITKVKDGNDILAQLGLVEWLAASNQRDPARALRQSVDQQIAELRRKHACHTCAGQPVAGSCKTCKGRGKTQPTCKTCQGTGQQQCNICSGKGNNRCMHCAGTGILPPRRGVRPPGGGPPPRKLRCRRCKGGRIDCKDCRGKGQFTCKTCTGQPLPETSCPACKQTCSDCGGSKLNLEPWAVLALALAMFHREPGDHVTARQYWKPLSSPSQFAPRWRDYFYQRLHENRVPDHPPKRQGG